MHSPLFLLPFWLCLFGLVRSQQYAGDIIPNSLPVVPGSEIAYFRIKDPAGKNTNLTLINYYSHGKDTQKRLIEDNVQRAVVFVHGLNRDPGTYMSNMLSALSLVTADANVNFDTVAIITPYFPNGADKGTGYPWTSGLSAGKGSTSNALVWQSSQWSAGGNNQYPYQAATVSSYTVLDQLIQYFDNTTLFPKMNQIVVAGHSLGAQMVQRYAAIGTPLSTRSPVSYWIGNPNSYAWLSTSRPLPTTSCPTYDVYREGYSNFTDYPMTYGTSLVASGRAAVLANFNSKAINYARGTQDLGDDSSTCAPYTTGKDRNERFFNFIKAFPPRCPDPKGSDCDTVDYVNTGHDAGAMMASAAGQARLFLDNFYGNGSRAYDFGYPREQAGDDPYPDPALESTAASTNNNTYAGNMTYWGCWSDQSPQTMTNLTYTSNANTIELCTQACAVGGNTIAGLEFGTQCFCGKALGYEATQVVESSCQSTCPGNSLETCGGYQRLSIFSSGRPQVLAPPETPEVVSGFYYTACYTEATSGRALTGKGTSSNSMTLEYCASFCTGYQYFGTEYSSECYCGNNFTPGANITNAVDCSYLCANDSTEYCGGSNRLTVYQDPDWVAPSSISATSLSSPSLVPASSTASSSPTSTILATPISASSSTSTAIVASSTPVTCPGSNTTTVQSNGQSFTIECGTDHSGGDMKLIIVLSFQQCIDACATTSGCVDVSLSGIACYLKSSLGAPVNNGVWGARLLASSSSSSSSSTSPLLPPSSTSSSVSTSSSSLASTSSTLVTAPAAPMSCPSSNATTVRSNGVSFLIECGIDHAGGDMKVMAVTGFQACIDACATTEGCVDVSMSGFACYLKSKLGGAVYNGVWGAKVLASISSSSSSSSLSFSSSSGTSILSASQTFQSVSVNSTTMSIMTATSASTSSLPSSTTLSPPVQSKPSTTLPSTSPPTSSTTSTSSSTLPSGFTALGCYTDSPLLRTLPHLNSSSHTTNTPSTCALACRGAGYPLSGTEYSTECWCGTTQPSASLLAPASDCNNICPPSSAQTCGGSNRLNVVQDTTYTAPIFVVRQTYSTWNLTGCYTDSTASRTLANSVSLSKSGGSANATVANCLDACAGKGYAFCGLEYYSECYGGHAAPATSELVVGGGGDVVQAGCGYKCTGNATEACGGSSRVLVYENGMTM